MNIFSYRHNFFELCIKYFGDKNMIVKEGILKDNDISLETLEVKLPNTTLLILEGYNAFAMCGALDTNIYNTPKMMDRKVICFKAIGVKTLEELYEAKIADLSNYAKTLGLEKGMYIKDAFKIISKE